MRRAFEQLGHDIFDLLVIGGGVYGLATAYDAAQRGMSVALVERQDFGGGASFNHHKTIHGGLRHLQRGNLVRMRESSVERNTFARIAPQFLKPQAFMLPTSRSIKRGRLALRTAFTIEAVMALDRNHDLPPELHLPRGRVVSTAEWSELAPGAQFAGITGGAVWFDYITQENERLTLAFGLAAARHGALLVNYAEAVEACREGTQLTGMRVRDVVSGDACVVRARVTCNAGGAAAGRLMAAFGVRRPFPLLKAMNVVTRRPAGAVALGAPTRTGRLLIALPWRGRLAVGTFHGAETIGADATDVDASELDRFLAEINEAFPWLALERDDVALVHRGLVPARPQRRGAPELLEHSQIVDHAREGIEGAFSLIGVKYTVARLIAERAVDLARSKIGLAPLSSRSTSTPLIPPAPADSLGDERLGHIKPFYEPSAFERLGALAAEDRLMRGPIGRESAVIRAQVLEAVRHEMALTLEDVVLRRTSLGSTGYPGDEAVEAVATVIRKELGWSDARVADEIEAVRNYYALPQG
jgi:glycerol-3-phosphate dehydrogenase